MNLFVKYIFRIIPILLVMNSCEPSLDLNIILPDDKIVIDGWIESGQYASVLLTANSPYFSRFDSASMRDLVLSRAKLSLVHNEDTTILTMKKNELYFPPFIYKASDFRGEVGEKYTIIAEYGGKIAMAETTIPQVVKMDTLYYQKTTDSDSLCTLFIEFTDPSEKNYYRIHTRRRNKDAHYKSTFFVALDDKYFNEKKAEISLSGVSESMLSYDKANYFKLGDTISVKLSTMDKESFDFWSSYQEEMINANNPFAASLINLNSNVLEDGLGIWSGYGVSVKEIILE